MVNDVRDPDRADAADAAGRSGPASGVASDARVHGRRGLILLAIAAWNVWVWGTRIANIVRDTGDLSAAFVGVHLALYGGSLALAAVLAVLGTRMWRESRGGATRDLAP